MGIKYRRIPLLSIGRDVYCDTRLILAKLDEHFPASKYPPLSTPQSKGTARLLESLTVDGGGFARAAQLIPSSMPILKDPKWLEDRKDFAGRSWKQEDMERARPEAVAHMRKVFDTFETLLEDGRQWIAGTDKPSDADVEGELYTKAGLLNSADDYDSGLGSQLVDDYAWSTAPGVLFTKHLSEDFRMGRSLQEHSQSGREVAAKAKDTERRRGQEIHSFRVFGRQDRGGH